MMRFRTNQQINVFMLIVFLLIQNGAHAQWAAPYANQWIRYGKPYLKIGIARKGLHKISFASLPKGFPTNSPDKIQLWRRGKQVAIISTANKEILFYAVPNDGASDSLLYRPMSARVNPYFSMYSDEGSYFLTIGDEPGIRAKTAEQPIEMNVPLLPFHQETVTTALQQDYTLSTQISITKPSHLNSFFESGASRTSKVQDEGSFLTGSFKLKNLVNGAQKPVMKLLVHGRSEKDHKIELHAGKNLKSLRLVKVLACSGFNPVEHSFEIQPGDYDAEGNGILYLKTVKEDRLDKFSLTYYSVTFPQPFQIEKEASKEFGLMPVKEPRSRISIKGLSSGFTVLDISDTDEPVVLKGKNESIMVPRKAGKKQLLLATKDMINVDAARIKEVIFKPIFPKEPNYIIITTDTLRKSAGEYAHYRASSHGGGFKTLVVSIKDIYNQFNYGEPSPVAIKRFMAYMLTEGGKDKFLFLIGKSITHNEKMKRELPDEVPTIGYPGSDMLLVEGIAGTAQDVPAVPVGRLSAITNQHVTDYLQKVKEYESSSDYSWRKNVLHLNGGKTVEEISQLKGLLAGLEPDVEKGQLGGKVKPFAKQRGMAEVENVNITAEVNAGAGLITYMGHGAPYVTDLDIGYITDAARGYNNVKKYPVMYFNGCGVGNVFSNRFNPHPKTPTSADRMTLSLDWLLTPKRGAIAVIANSFESYVTPSTKYLQRLYHYMFVNDKTVNQPIGKILVAVANDIVSKDKDEYTISNVHQSFLQGDPALKLITVDKPDYAVEPDESISLHAQSESQTFEASDSIKVRVAMSNNGRFVANGNVPVELTYFGRNGNVIKNKSVKSFPNQNTIEVAFLNKKDMQKVRIEIDPKHTISELSSSNNVAEMQLDWDLIKDKKSFSSDNAKDIIPPVLTVFFNDRLLKDGELVAPNPNLKLLLSDDRQLLPDTAFVEIFIKRCADDQCDFEKITHSDHKIEMGADGLNTLTFNYLSDLGPGVYEILINAKDRSGNAAAQPYRMRFEISDDENPPTELIVSPNPASSYLRFELKSPKRSDIKSVRSLIYNQKGIIVEDKTLSVPAGALTTEWYWLPSYLSAGLYTYKVFLINDRNEAFITLPGKIIMTGDR